MSSVDAHLGEITDAADRHLDELSGRSPEKHDYRAALEAMERLGGESAVERLTAEMKASIRESETMPQEQSVRSLGRDILDREGREIPADSWFAR